MSSGNTEPGGDFSPSGTITTYADELVAPALLEGVVKDALVVLAIDTIQGEGLVDLVNSIVDAIGDI